MHAPWCIPLYLLFGWLYLIILKHFSFNYLLLCCCCRIGIVEKCCAKITPAFFCFIPPPKMLFGREKMNFAAPLWWCHCHIYISPTRRDMMVYIFLVSFTLLKRRMRTNWRKKRKVQMQIILRMIYQCFHSWKLFVMEMTGLFYLQLYYILLYYCCDKCWLNWGWHNIRNNGQNEKCFAIAPFWLIRLSCGNLPILINNCLSIAN